ncbi:MAG: hypothetical protein MJB14_23035 [Spirochaetes bacterium]|nr:hypothetical protein [Spirochaetota bacterium]
MQKKIFILLIILKTILTLNSNPIFDDFIGDNVSTILKDLFTLNIGIMELKKRGNLNAIDTLDIETVLNSIENELAQIYGATINQKTAMLKGLRYYQTKKNITALDYLIKTLFFKDQLTNQDLLRILSEFRKDQEFKDISKMWSENLTASIYQLKVIESFERIVMSNKIICQNKSIDILISGSIEK